MVDVYIENLRHIFKDRGSEIVAVDGIDLTIHDGEFVTLVGPSGCGKTTTLRCVAGLETPTSGTIRFGDKDVTRLPVQERNIALLFQDIALYPHMSVRDNMAYGLKIAGISREERYARVEQAAQLLKITDQLDKSPADLSGGQRQRAALGRSIVRNPSVFLFDEPMSDLDAKLKRELRPVIQRVTNQIGCPTLYVTHDQEEAMTMSDRIAVMNNGKLEQIGTPKAVYEDPQSEFVGGFIGQPNTQFMNAVIGRENGSMTLQITDFEFPFPTADGRLDDYLNESIRIGIRPQHISVSDNPDDGIKATHILDEPLGDETHSFFETPLGEVVVVTGPAFEGNGQEYGLVLETEFVKVFDPETGVRIG